MSGYAPSVSDTASREDDLPRMTLREHLDELRRRLIISTIAVVAGMLLAFTFHQEIFEFVKQPYLSAIAKYGLPNSMQSTGVGETFITILKVCFLAGAVLVGPVVLWQLWGFIAAGLYEEEKRWVRIFFPVSVGLFAIGMLAAYRVLIPFGLNFLIGFDIAAGVSPNYKISEYLSTCLTMVFAMGILFELPLVMLFLQGTNIVQRKTFLRGWKFAVLLSFVVGMFLTDPSPVTQFAMAVPIVVLYFLGIWGGRFVGENSERFTLLKSWPLLIAAAAITALLVFSEQINDWSAELFGVEGVSSEAPAGAEGGAGTPTKGEGGEPK